MEEIEFANYKEKQKYFNEKYKNRGEIFFSQPEPIWYKNGKKLDIPIRPKGKTYVKPKKEGE